MALDPLRERMAIGSFLQCQPLTEGSKQFPSEKYSSLSRSCRYYGFDYDIVVDGVVNLSRV